MADVTTQEQIIREAPEIEAYKLGLLQLAQQRANIPVSIPGYQVAGLAPEQQQAVQLTQAGLGSYLPYLNRAGASYTQAGGLYAGLPNYGTNIVGALTSSGTYATGQAQEALRRSAAASDLSLAYGAGSLADVGRAAQQAAGYGTGAVGAAQTGVGASTQYGAGALGTMAGGAAAASQQAQAGINQALALSGQATGYGTTATGAGFAGAQGYDPNAVFAYMNPYQQAAAA